MLYSFVNSPPTLDDVVMCGVIGPTERLDLRTDSMGMDMPAVHFPHVSHQA